ncbi:hypothetical protein KC959_04420, partial [Candidatus Saccharibacteria bacterium]|nr:hypothetical protein [Candidatus Saccharibacteria bacterium]
MSERSSNPEIPALKDIAMVEAGNARYRNKVNGEFIANAVGDTAKANAETVLLDTVDELREYGHDVSKSDYLTYADDLGLNDDYMSWHKGSAIKSFDKERLLEDADKHSSKPDVEKENEESRRTAYEAKQAEYDKMAEELGPESNEQLDRRIEGSEYRRRVAKHNKEHAEKTAIEKAQREADNKVENAGNLRQKSITELADILGEKLNFNTPKSEYISRVQKRQEELADKKAVAPKLDMSTPSVKEPSESTKVTVQALKDFQSEQLSSALNNSKTTSSESESVEVENKPFNIIDAEKELSGIVSRAKNGEVLGDDVLTYARELAEKIVDKFSETMSKIAPNEEEERDMVDSFRSYINNGYLTRLGLTLNTGDEQPAFQSVVSGEGSIEDFTGGSASVARPYLRPVGGPTWLASTSDAHVNTPNDNAENTWGIPTSGSLADTDFDRRTRPSAANANERNTPTEEKRRGFIRRNAGKIAVAAALTIAAVGGTFGALKMFGGGSESENAADKTEQVSESNTAEVEDNSRVIPGNLT